MKWLFGLYCLITLVATSCHVNEDIPSIDLNAKVQGLTSKLESDTSKDSIELDLCSEVPFRWDTILILSPYVPYEKMEALDIQNSYKFKQFYQELDDSKSTFVYLHKNRIVGYSDYDNSIDIFSMRLKKYRDFNILTRENCGVLYIVKNMTGKTKYRFVNRTAKIE